MSEKDYWAAVGRGLVDSQFAQGVLADWEAAIAGAGFELSPAEKAQFIRVVTEGPAALADVLFQRADMEKRATAGTKRLLDLSEYTVNLFKETLTNAGRTYRAISLMNRVMFWVGIVLFVGAAVYGAISREILISFVFGGLGAATFVLLFLTGPIEKTQTALSNLVQAEISFMNYFEQISFWEMVATPQGNPPVLDVEKVEHASDILQKRSTETIKLLQRFLEPQSGELVSIVEDEEPTTPAPAKK